MKSLLALAASLAVLALSGCGQLDVTPEGDPSRVLNGTLEMGDPVEMPADATATIRVVDSSVAGMPPQVLGSVTQPCPGMPPLAFRVEYRAEDELLRRGLNVEVRISYGGKVRFYNLNRYAVTLGNAAAAHRIYVVRTGT